MTVTETIESAVPFGESSATQTTHGARDHARSMAGTTVRTMPTIPSTAATDLPDAVLPDMVVWDEVVAGGGYTSIVLRRGTVVRIDDTEGDSCAAVLLHNARFTSERLNVADTVKVQWQAYLGTGAVMLSDMGRAMATMIADTSGHHDAFCGASTRASNERRYGDGNVSGPYPNARDQFIVGLTKHGLSRRDVAPNVNFFKGVTVEDGGALTFHHEPGTPSFVELRMEMDVILTIVNSPHPLDPRESYVCTPLRVTAWNGSVTGPSDAQWTSSPERERAYLNTEQYYRTGLAALNEGGR